MQSMVEGLACSERADTYPARFARHLPGTRGG
jgi:hypothetical protein